MIKQIVIKHSRESVEQKVKNIVKYFNLILNTDENIFCEFVVKDENSEVLQKICDLDKLEKKIVQKKVNMSVFLNIPPTYIERVIRLCVIYEISVVFECQHAKLFLNDNDGDFIIIDSKNEKYKLLKNEYN